MVKVKNIFLFKRTIILISILLCQLIISEYASSSVFITNESNDQLKILQTPSTSTDVIELMPAINEISVNEFSQFNLSGKKLRLIYNGIEKDDFVTPKLIIIKSPIIELYEEIELVGEPADILLINNGEGSNDNIICSYCKFTNFGRITLATATSESTTSDNLSDLGKLSTFNGGTVDINHLDASGAQSLEIIAEHINTSGTITTNMNASKDANGGYTLNAEGEYVAGSGGINLYIGTSAVTYEGLNVTEQTENHYNDTINIGGEFQAATISIISSRPVLINSNTKLSTKSDMIATSVHQKNMITPVEGVFIQTNRKGYSDITIDGEVTTDNKIQLVSLNNIQLNNTVVANDVFIVAGNYSNLTTNAVINSAIIAIGADSFSNQGAINSTNLEIETKYTLYNHFGGKIKSDDIKLISLQGTVINGSRTSRENVLENLLPLLINEQLTANDKYGIYEQIKDEQGIQKTNLSASMIANNINIKAERFENINPYHFVKPIESNWIDGIDVDVNTSRRVSVLAEQSLQIEAAEYLLNSSAIIGLNQHGNFDINSPKLMNQRYRLEAELAIFSRQTYDVEGVDGISSGSNANGESIETYLTAYSPPAVMYSFGEFSFSDGTENSVNHAQLINQFSFFEILNDAHLYNTDLQSIGIMMAGRPGLGFEPVRCAAYGCSASTYTSLIEYETLTSFSGMVYGVSSNLKVITVNQLEDATKQLVLDAFIEDYSEQVAHDVTYYNPTSLNAIYSRTHHYVSKTEIKNMNGNDVLYITEQRCLIINYQNTGLNQTCNSIVEAFGVAEILLAAAGDTLVNGLNYTGNEIREQATQYISGLSQTGSLDLGSSYGTVSGTYVKEYTLWTLTGNNEFFNINYNVSFVPNNPASLSEGQSRTAAFYSSSGIKTVAVEELMSSLVPQSPSNFHVTGTTISEGEGTISLAWNAVGGAYIEYYVNGVSVGSALNYTKVVNTLGTNVYSFNVVACNTINRGGSSSTAPVELTIPPLASQVATCNDLFYRQLTNQYTTTPTSANGWGETGNHCGMKQINDKTYLIIAEQELYSPAPDAWYLRCNQVRTFEKNALITALLNGNDTTFEVSGYLTPSLNKSCSEHLSIPLIEMNW